MALQKTSAVAGIVSAIVAVATFIILLNDRGEHELVSEPRIVAKTPNPTPVQEDPISPEEPKISIQLPTSGECSARPKLDHAFEAAGSIYYNDERDEVLSKLIDKALCKETIDFAIQAAAKVYYNESRDLEYMKIVQFYLSNSEFDLAKVAAGKIYYNKTRDAANRLIIEHAL
ncbi:hypothetical protein [Aliagarivorans marinus]|uniref:hypothetical protein n=1 Tax=Aliagarivorans marinus TaxID=561965 RepID=UPI00047D2F2A|nr:hypothetical protein [Aliagarivorans marinus]